MGALLAWLRFPCDGDPRVHKSRFDPIVLTHQTRCEARAWGHNLGTLAECFAMERARWPSEASDEPEAMP